MSTEEKAETKKSEEEKRAETKKAREEELKKEAINDMAMWKMTKAYFQALYTRKEWGFIGRDGEMIKIALPKVTVTRRKRDTMNEFSWFDPSYPDLLYVEWNSEETTAFMTIVEKKLDELIGHKSNNVKLSSTFSPKDTSTHYMTIEASLPIWMEVDKQYTGSIAIGIPQVHEEWSPSNRLQPTIVLIKFEKEK